jgi:hypothetical protein
MPLGDGEFIAEGLRYFVRGYPERNELVVRGLVWAYCFKRAE